VPHSPPVPDTLLTVVETDAYLAKAGKLMSEAERLEIVNTLAADPECGEVIRGGGGIRKARFGLSGRGKRGGARVVYFYHSRRIPAFLLTVFAKNERSDLTQDEINQLAKAVKLIAKTYGE
jgi:hypothetical protein